MMTLINFASLVIILGSLLVLVCHPKIKLPIHVDIIMLVIAIGALAVFINTVLGKDLYWEKQHAEIWIRFGFACLTIRYLYQTLKGVNHEND